MEKLSVGSSDFMVGDQSVLIDLSSWYKEALAPKIEEIRMAIEKCRVLEFIYYSPRGETARQIEPYYLIFRWANWYVWGFCKEKEDFRLFKLNRMDKVRIVEQVFVKRQVPMPDLTNEKIFPGGIRVKALFEPEYKWRLVEEFGTSCFREMEDGKLLFEADYTNRENLLTWLLTFRDKVELLEPEDIRAEIIESAERIREKYAH